MAENDSGDKKHDPTPMRLEQARREGKNASAVSRDLASAVVLLIAVVLLMTVGKQIAIELYEYSCQALLDPLLLVPENREPDGLKQSALAFFSATVFKFLKPFSVFSLLLVVAAIAVNILQIGFHWLPDKLAFNFNHINPVNGFGRMFSLQSVVRLLMGIGKIIICAVVAWYAVEGSFGEMIHLSENDNIQIVSFLLWLLLMIGLKVAVALVILALLDLMYQRWKYMQDMRMSDQELRDEFKNTIGDPQIISKRKQIQQEMAKKQRVQGTPDADVVVTNPTHFAVAIKYDITSMDFPVVVAKGADYLAYQIRKIAAEHNIPVVERKPLARAMYNRIEIGQKVTPELLADEHMKTLAEVISYAYKLSGREHLTRRWLPPERENR